MIVLKDRSAEGGLHVVGRVVCATRVFQGSRDVVEADGAGEDHSQATVHLSEVIGAVTPITSSPNVKRSKPILRLISSTNDPVPAAQT